MNIAENKKGLFIEEYFMPRNIGPAVAYTKALGIILYQNLIIAKAMVSFQVVKRGKQLPKTNIFALGFHS
jgi:hypothetical protein